MGNWSFWGKGAECNKLLCGVVHSIQTSLSNFRIQDSNFFLL